MLRFCNHPFFTKAQSKIADYHGEWMKRNQHELADFASMSVEHGQEKFILEIMKNSNRGKGAGWPDLVAWSENDLLFAEVKSTDSLSKIQRQWIKAHQGLFKIEIIRIIDKSSPGTSKIF